MEIRNVQKLREFKKGERVSKKLVDNENVVISVHYYSTNASVQSHKHADSVDIYYVIEGKGEVTVGEERKILKKGNVLTVPKNTPHGVMNPFQKPLIILDILAPRPRRST